MSTVWSDQHQRGLRMSQSHRMIYHYIMRDRAWPCRVPCFVFDDFPSTVGGHDDA